MGKLAYIFPGQGSQYVGMGKDIASRYTTAQNVYSEADDVLHERLSELCFNGPEEELRLTSNTQPALLATSVALWKVFMESGAPEPNYVAGHSLGEYSALVAAGAIRFDDAVRTVRQRGKLMEEAVPAGTGAMAAVLGLEREKLLAVCEEVSATNGPVELANLNCPGQIVISGTTAAVEIATERAKAAGARRVQKLAVSGPFHSSLMRSAGEQLAQVLREIDIVKARVPVIANVTARPVQDSSEIVETLTRQVASSVLWEDSVRLMMENGVDTFVEIGPGRVLSGLIRKINRKVSLYNVEDPDSMDKTLTALKYVTWSATK